MIERLEDIPEGYMLTREGLIHPKSTFGLEMEMSVFREDGTQKSKLVQPARSLTKNFALIWATLFAAGKSDFTSVFDDWRHQNSNDYALQWKTAVRGMHKATANTQTPCILFGTGTNAVTTLDRWMQTEWPITAYPNNVDCTVTEVTDTTSVYSFKVHATKTNSGSSVDLTEMGAAVSVMGSSNNNHCMVARDVFSPVTVAGSESVIGSYLFTMTA